MSSPLSQAGAVGTPSKFAPLHTNRFFTGLWTQRNPLRDAATPFLYEKFYSGSRFDSIIDGLNVEITPRLTLARRCGHSVYNSQTFTAINRFYEFRTFSTSAEIIHVMADCISNVYDATGPNLKKNILTKTAGAGSTYFQSVGNMLFMGNGVDQKKWVQTTKQWQDFFAFNPFDVIVDSNNNLQVATGARSANIISVSITGNVVTLTFDKKVALLFYAGMVLTISGLTGATFLNGSTITLSSVSYNQVRGAFVHANYGPTSDLGTAATLRGVTAGFEPVWATNAGDITPDGSEQWLCKGSSVQNWGISAPTVAPTAVNAIKPSPYNTWAANTVYSNSLSLVDGGGFVQRLTTGGITGGAMPAFNPVVGGTTADGTCVWTNEGAAAWAAGTTFATGALIEVTGSYEVTVPCFSGNTKVRTNEGPKEFAKSGVTEIIETEFGLRPAKLLVHEFDGEMIDMGGGELVTLDHMIKRDGKYIRAEKAFADKPRVHHVGPVFNYSVFTDNPDERHYILENGEVAHNSKDPDSGYTYTQTFTAVFECTFGGVSGGSEPAWIDGYGAIVSDGGITWQNIGNGLDWAATIGAATAVSLDQIIIDANGYKQQIQNSGKSGGAAPTWSETLSATTVDNLASWINIGVFSKANTGSQKYAFAPKNSITGEVATASPESAAFTLAGDSVGTIQGPGAITTLPTLAGTIVTHQVGTAGPAALLVNGDWFFIVYGVTSNGNEQPVGREATQNFTGFGLLKAMRVSGPALPADIVKWRVYYGRTAGGENQYAETVDLVSGLDISQPGTPGTPQGAVDPQCDVIQIYRTVQGGSTLLLLDEIPMPPARPAVELHTTRAPMPT
jgi:hypothetical protein